MAKLRCGRALGCPFLKCVRAVMEGGCDGRAAEPDREEEGGAPLEYALSYKRLIAKHFRNALRTGKSY